MDMGRDSWMADEAAAPFGRYESFFLIPQLEVGWPLSCMVAKRGALKFTPSYLVVIRTSSWAIPVVKGCVETSILNFSFGIFSISTTPSLTCSIAAVSYFFDSSGCLLG